jgi:hypothetical protein
MGSLLNVEQRYACICTHVRDNPCPKWWIKVLSGITAFPIIFKEDCVGDNNVNNNIACEICKTVSDIDYQLIDNDDTVILLVQMTADNQ